VTLTAGKRVYQSLWAIAGYMRLLER